MNNGEENARCSFCDEEYSSSSIGEHLMLCGNKTDQCPNCRKYIRRAVFAYHYGNNCANLDECNGQINRGIARNFNAPSTFKQNNSSHFASTSAIREVSRVTGGRVSNIAQHPAHQTIGTPSYINSGRFLCIPSILYYVKLFRRSFIIHIVVSTLWLCMWPM